MVQVISWAVTVLVSAAIVSFVVSVFAVARLPDERPEVHTFDRNGHEIGPLQNPGEQIAPGRSGDPIGQRQNKSEG